MAGRRAHRDRIVEEIFRHPMVVSLLETGGSAIRGEDPLYLVGGALRDFLTGREPVDLDVVGPGEIHRVARHFARDTGGHFFTLDGERGVFRVVYRNRIETVDFARMKGASLIRDLGSRDFTVNSMGVVLSPGESETRGELVDPFDGQSDLRRGILRMTSSSVFENDPLRLLRAVRIASQLDFDIEGLTLRRIVERRCLISTPSPERVRDELFLLLQHPCSARTVNRIRETGVVQQWVTRILEKGPEHTLALRGEADAILSRPVKEIFQDCLPAVGDRGDVLEGYLTPLLCDRRSIEVLVRLALFTVAGIHHAPHLEIAPWRALAPLGDALCLSGKETTFLRRIDAGCAMLDGFFRNGSTGRLSPYRYFRTVSKAVPASLCLYSVLDRMTDGQDSGIGETLERMLLDYFDRWIPHVSSKPLVSGRDISFATGLPPGPAYGRVLDEIDRLRYSGAIRTAAAAKRYLEEHFSPGGKLSGEGESEGDWEIDGRQ